MSDMSFEKLTCGDIISKLNSIDNYSLPDDSIDNYSLPDDIVNSCKKSSKSNNAPKHRDGQTSVNKFNTLGFLHDMTDSIIRSHEKPTKVIFHDPATIAYWPDGQKTVSKCMAGDKYDPELGLIICYMHRFAPQSFKSDIRKFVSTEYRSVKIIRHGASSFAWVKKDTSIKDTDTKENK